MDIPRSWTLVASPALIAGLCTALLCATSCGDDGGTPSSTDGPMVHGITVNDGFYYPRDLTITRGDSVIWTWADNDDHSVTEGMSPDPSEEPRLFDSGIRNSGSFGHRFSVSGSYSYFCREHGDMGMTGRITIQEP